VAATSYKINDSLYLVQDPINTNKETTKKAAPGPVNHIAVIDCSGSMYSDLPKIRQQMKNKLPKLLKENDTISIVWFSGRGQYGTLIEGEKVAGLTDLQQIHGAIDRWLKCVGLTGFKEPLIEVKALCERVSKLNSGAFSLFFMSDGCDNQWSRNDILAAIEQTAPSLSSATFVEYGYYADRPMLTAMAEKAGGQLIFSDSFDRYEAVFEEAVTKQVIGGPRIEHSLPNADFVGGFCWSVGEGEVIAYKIDGNKVSVPESLDQVFFLSPGPVGQVHAFDMEYVSKVCWETPAATNAVSPSYFDAVYAGISLFATRMKPEVVKPLLKASGDVYFIEQFANCFGKQAYSKFMDEAKAAAFNSTKRFQNGWDPTRVPRDDAFTVLGMLQLLSKDDDNRILFAHEKFSYSRIGRGRVDSNTVLTQEEQDEIAELQAQLTTTKDPKAVAKISARITEISDKPEALKFVADPAKEAEGYSISSLTFNEDRPNVSVLVTKEGTVDLSVRKDKPKTVPDVIKTKVFRNYTIIKDGLVNVETLPMKLSNETQAELKNLVATGLMPNDVVETDPATGVTLIHFSKLPVINAMMTKAVSAKALFTKQYETLQAKARQKVLNSFYKEEFPDEVKGDGWKETFGEEAVSWLKEQGLTEYSGFSPKSVQAEATDFYMGKELPVKLKGLSSLPSLKDVRAKRESGKLNASAKLMDPSVTEVEKVLASKKGDDLKAWLDGEKKQATAEARRLMFEMAQDKFAVIVGQTWFTEFSSLDENTLDVTMPDGEKVTCTVEMKEVEIKI